MSSKIDIMHFQSINHGDQKIGELQVNEDGSLEGVLFENKTLLRIIAERPKTVALGLILFADRPAT